jgi:alanine racemase
MSQAHQRSWVELSKQAFTHNIEHLKAILPADTVFAPVIKANAYGHDLYTIARLCQESSYVDWLCVGLLSEALALRAHGITKPLLVIGCIDADPVLALTHSVQLLVYSYAVAQELSRAAIAHKGRFDVHIKIDTGLSRLGLMHTDAVAQIVKIAQLPGLRVTGIYSHFAQAQADNAGYSQHQITLFKDVLAQLKTHNIVPPYIHISNSAATMRFSIPECNLFRIGAGIYGLWPSQRTQTEVMARYPHFSLRPILTWKTRVMHIQSIDTGSFVGYNCTQQVTRPSRIAILPVGYQDGYDIQFSNRGQVKIDTHYAPVIGRICMNHMMVDITDIPRAHIGQEVILIGHDGPHDVYALAQLSGNNNVREPLIHIAPHFPRIVID